MSVQPTPRLIHVPDSGHGGLHGERALQPGLCFLDALAAGPGCCPERVDADVFCADGFHVGGELALCGGHIVTRPGDIGVIPGGGAERDLPKLFEGKGGDVLVKEPKGDRGGCGASAGARPSVADVHLNLCGGAAHDVPAPCAPCEPREQRGTVSDATRRAGNAHLSSFPFLHGDERRVRVGVEVLTDLQFAEVDAVRKQLPDATRGHAEPVGDLHDRYTVSPVGERPAHIVGSLVGDELPCLLVAAIPGRGLPSLPHAGGGGVHPAILEPVDVLLTFTDRVREVDVPNEPAIRGACVEAFGGAVNVSACCLYPVPDFDATAGPCEARQVRDHDPVVAPGLYAFDGGEQRWPLIDWFAAADGQFGGHELDLCAEFCGVSLDGRDLFFVGVEAVTGPSSDEAHTYNSRPQGSHDVEPY